MRWHFHLIGDLCESEKVPSNQLNKQKTVNSNQSKAMQTTLNHFAIVLVIASSNMYSMQF